MEVNALGNEVPFSFELRVAPANLSAGYPATLVQFYINKIEMNSTRNGIIVTLQKKQSFIFYRLLFMSQFIHFTISFHS